MCHLLNLTQIRELLPSVPAFSATLFQNTMVMAGRRAILVVELMILSSMAGLLSAEELVNYTLHIKPILAERCFACHGALKQNSGLRLDSGPLILAGSDSGPVIVPGKPAESLLIGMVTGKADLIMPPEGEGTSLKTEEIELFKRWVAEGAQFPDEDQPERDPRSYWSYQPVTRPKVPQLQNPALANNPIDALLAAHHEKNHLIAVKAAEPHTLLRRVYLDLIGMPPTKGELQKFLDGPSDVAYEAVVDKLLASPHYGERWGRHWMDIWRYSDWYGSTAANEIRNSQYHIWHWRDWIIESLNEDKGYDRMLHEMLAADELVPEDREAIRATGYLARSWYLFNRTTWLIDTVDHFNMAFLGITMKCARCHDHKYDPILQTDYYRFRAIFEPHDVRTDPYPGEMDTKINGLPRVYDKTVDAPTYLFVRGDERSPDKENPLTAGVPEIFNMISFEPEEITRSVESRCLELQPEFVEIAAKEITWRICKSRKNLASLETELKALQAQKPAVEATVQPWRADMVRDAASDLFQQFSPDEELSVHWEQLAGKWSIDGALLRPELPSGKNTAYLATKDEHPMNFYTRVVYRTLAPGTFRSIGFSFDMQQPGNSQDIYTSTGDERQSVQAFHRIGGKDIYPTSGIVNTLLKVGRETTVEVVVRGRDLRIWLNGDLKLDYILPKERQPGKFATWVYGGTAEFMEIAIHSIRPSSTDIQREIGKLQLAIEIKKKEVESIEMELTALQSRVAAERAKYLQVDGTDGAEVKGLAIEADKAGKLAAQLLIQRGVLERDYYLSLVNDLDSSAIQGRKTIWAYAQLYRATFQVLIMVSKEAISFETGEF
jgi:hypothetical protein